MQRLQGTTHNGETSTGSAARISFCMKKYLSEVVPMCVLKVFTGFRWKPCCKGFLIAVATSSMGAFAQARFSPPADQIVLPASVHAQGNQADSLREVERAWRQNRND